MYATNPHIATESIHRTRETRTRTHTHTHTNALTVSQPIRLLRLVVSCALMQTYQTEATRYNSSPACLSASTAAHHIAEHSTSHSRTQHSSTSHSRAQHGTAHQHSARARWSCHQTNTDGQLLQARLQGECECGSDNAE